MLDMSIKRPDWSAGLSTGFMRAICISLVIFGGYEWARDSQGGNTFTRKKFD